MSNLEWADVETEFEYDGSLRDIYVLSANILDWQALLDHLRNSEYSLSYTLDGQADHLPERAEDIFAIARNATPMLSVAAGGITYNCHFFRKDVIEFDLSTDDITSFERFESLAAFIRMIGHVTHKAVILTPENRIDSPILRLTPEVGQFVYCKSKQAGIY